MEIEIFERIGTFEEKIIVNSADIISAIENKKAVLIVSAIIMGDLNLQLIQDKFYLEEQRIDKKRADKPYGFGRTGYNICSSISISFSTITGSIMFDHDKEMTPFTFEDWSGLQYVKEQRFYVFKSEIDFFNCEIQGSCNFEQARFNERIKFTSCDIKGPVNFNHSIFRRGANFRNTKFNEDVSFKKSIMGGNFSFRSVKFKSPADFSYVSFEKQSAFATISNEYIAPIMMSIINKFISPDKNINWSRLQRRRNQQFKIPYTKFEHIETELMIKNNPYLVRYIKDEQWIEGWMHYLSSKSIYSKKKSHFISKFIKRTFYFLWLLTSNCGRSIGLWGFWAFLISFLFGELYAAHPHWFSQIMGPLSPWYFSVVTFTTLGFGDLTPKPECWQAQIWIMLEVIFGYLMLGGLISIFANKFARRS